ncbi:DUF689-domain-containing protein [Polychaeton citri CBS 116435]|uniref:DUF689-domain-containing protein n=1 Tax=Polychaeton citri CBS 116435 TaxID=1314669 RepID=A0A9P4UJF3_9PEZI|nr:DUF689-domain-containing protein [Polychaeton citri CBS 116435]
MAPSFATIDNTPDFDFPTATTIATTQPHQSPSRTLLLAPASVAAHPEALNRIVEAHDRHATDIQMLDRLALDLVSLPAATYDVVMLLSDVENVQQNKQLWGRETFERIVPAMKSGAQIRSQDGSFGIAGSASRTEGVLAGLVDGGASGGMVKPASSGEQTVKLSFGKKKANAAAAPANGIEAINAAKRKSVDMSGGNVFLNGYGNGNGAIKATPTGVGFINNLDDMGPEDDDEDLELPSNEELERAGKIDPETLLTEEDRQKPLIIPDACKPNTKRRRACKDCSCGLAQRLEAEDKATRENADSNLAKLTATDLTEVDFTVQGKVGSCGNCALGDAFRCDGCPYIGLPAFKPGEQVRLLDNDVQL